MTVILSVSLPDHLRDALDAEAGRQRRSRSFVVAEAVTRYLAARQAESFEAARLETMRQTLALPPARRVELAEELWDEFARNHPPAKPWTAGFDTFEEYEAWRGAARRSA
jgi:predicted transcriptional regulator